MNDWLSHFWAHILRIREVESEPVMDPTRRVLEFEAKLERARQIDGTPCPGPCPKFTRVHPSSDQCSNCRYLKGWHDQLYEAWGIDQRPWWKRARDMVSARHG